MNHAPAPHAAAPNELLECRDQVDRIDQQLHALLLERLAVVHQVAIYKQRHQLPLTQPDREQQLLETYRLLTPTPLQASVTNFFAHLMELSKAYQHQVWEENPPDPSTLETPAP